MALQEYEDGICPGCGQMLSESMDGDLLDEWTTMDPLRCGACTALARADAKAQREKHEHPGALRYVVGLPDGAWERKALAVAARAERAAAQEQQ